MEGQRLAVIRDKLAVLEGFHRQLVSWLGYGYRIPGSFAKRVQELTEGIEIDPNRLAVGVAIFADKSILPKNWYVLKAIYGDI